MTNVHKYQVHVKVFQMDLRRPCVGEREHLIYEQTLI